jgi:hypothetical protein
LAVIVVAPAAVQFASPAPLGAFAMVATAADDELQWLFSVMSCVPPSLKVPVAVNCCVLPAATVGALGVTASVTKVPVPIVRTVLPVTPDAEADIVAVPLFLPCAMPVDLIEAIFGFDDFHETPARLEATLPSLNVPVALNFIDVPFSIRGFAGFTVMETKCALETVNVVDPFTEPNAAVIVVLPVATLVAVPRLSMVAVAAEEEVQNTDVLISWLLESLKVPVATNCFVVPTAMVEFAGVTAIETSVAAVTVREAVPLTPPEVAVIVAVPVPTPVARPVESTFAVEVDEEFQLTAVSN